LPQRGNASEPRVCRFGYPGKLRQEVQPRSGVVSVIGYGLNRVANGGFAYCLLSKVTEAATLGFEAFPVGAKKALPSSLCVCTSCGVTSTNILHRFSSHVECEIYRAALPSRTQIPNQI